MRWTRQRKAAYCKTTMPDGESEPLVRIERRVAWVVLVVLSLVLGATGGLLVHGYAPIEAFMNQYHDMKQLQVVVPAVRVARNLHIWATRVLVTVLSFHVLFVIALRLTRGRRMARWKSGTLAVAALALLAVSGPLFPWEESSGWVASVAPRPQTAFGELVDPHQPTNPRYDARAYLGPVSTTGLWLFFAAHCLVLPVIAGTAIYLQRRRRSANSS